MNVLNIWINREPGIEFKGRNLPKACVYFVFSVVIYLELEYQHTMITWRLDWRTISSGYPFVVFVCWGINLQTSFEHHALEFALWLSLVSLLMLLVCKLIFIEDFTNSFRTLLYTYQWIFIDLDLRTKVRCLTNCQKWMEMTDNSEVRDESFSILQYTLHKNAWLSSKYRWGLII